MVQAENGNTKELHAWLESDSHQFKRDMDLVSQADLERRTLDTEMPIRSIRIDQPNSATQIVNSAEPSNTDPPSDTAPFDETDHIKLSLSQLILRLEIANRAGQEWSKQPMNALELLDLT